MGKLHASFFFSAVDKYLSLVITVAMAAIAARLLTPGEIGVFVISSAVVLLSETLRDFGASVYIIQRPVLSRESLRTAFTVMAAMSVAIASVLFLAAGSLAAFYADARLVPAVCAAAISLLFGSIAAPFLALLRREMRFGAIAFIDLAGLSTNLLAFLVLYWLNWNYLSLVLASLAASIAVAASVVLIVREFWIFKPCLTDWKAVLTFGGFASATGFLNTLYTTLPQMLLGRVSGFDTAALYSRATMLCQLPDKSVVGAFQPVIFPAFAEEARAGGNLKSAYLYALTLLSAMQWPALLCLALLAEPAVRIMLGPQWDAAAPVLRIMALAWLVMMPSSLTYPVLVASGGIRDTLLSSLIGLPVSILVIVVVAPFGIEALAYSMFATLPFQMVLALIFIRRRIGLGWAELFGALWKSAVASIGAAVFPAGSLILFGPQPDLSMTALSIIFFGSALGWLATLWLTRHPLLREMQGLSALIWRARPNPLTQTTS